ncbi:MAG: hypothetical protein GTO14_02755 [Anaerolineales bacterium]|nr:hypothetical protein [Anaerolineales bacterium]
MTLYGKGYFIWQVPRCDGGDPKAIVASAREAGLTHVLIKIADGPNWQYNVDKETGEDWVPPIVAELRNAGIQPWGWHYIMGYDPVGEARLAVSRTRALGLDGYVIDAEVEFKKRGKDVAARRFMELLRSGLEDLPIALSTYRFPNLHREFPYDEFMELCDYAMPQVYFERANNPEEQLDRCVEQYLSLPHARPVIPTAPTYTHGKWRPSADEILRLLQRAKDIGLSAVNAWSWDYARRPEHMDMWEAVANFDWEVGEWVADVPERLVGYMNKHDPAGIADLYAQRAAHVTGARTVLGSSAIREWYTFLFKQLLPNANFRLTGKSGTRNSRHFTWTATSDKGEVRNGNDILGILDDRIQYHYTYFTLSTA